MTVLLNFTRGHTPERMATDALLPVHGKRTVMMLVSNEYGQQDMYERYEEQMLTDLKQAWGPQAPSLKKASMCSAVRVIEEVLPLLYALCTTVSSALHCAQLWVTLLVAPLHRIQRLVLEPAHDGA